MAREWNLGLRDDRGAPLTLGDLAAGVRHDRKRGRPVLTIVQVFGYLGMAVGVWVMVTGRMQWSAREFITLGCVYGLFGVAMVLSWRYGTPGLRRRVWGPAVPGWARPSRSAVADRPRWCCCSAC